MKKDLAHIYNIQKEVFLLMGIRSLLGWDEQTHMPSKATENRAEQLKVIEEQIHEKMTSNKLKAALNRLKKRKLSKKDRVIVKELDKDVTKLRRIPKEFVKRLVKEQIISAGAWRRARKKNDFRIFKPHLKKIIALAKEKAKYLNPKISPYDALLNEMEEGMTTDKLTNLFNHLKVELIRLLDKIKSTKAFKDQKKLDLKIKNEEELVKDIIKKMGLA